MQPDEKLILMRVDGGDVIGYGHIMRDTALANELSRHGCQVIFYSRLLDGSGIETLRRENFDPQVIPADISEHEEPEWVINQAKINFGKPDFIVIDAYHLPDGHFDSYSRHAPVMTTDVFGGRDYRSLSIILNGYENAAGLDYSRVSDTCVKLLGTTYTLVRDDVYEKRLQKKQINREVKQILVNGGGVDEHDVTGKFAESLMLLDQKNWPEKAYFVTGLKYPFSDALDNKLEKLPFAQRLVQPENWLELLRDVDLAVTAGGSTVYEAAIYGTPLLALIVEENQIGSATAMEKRGIIKVAGWLKKLSHEQIAENYKNICQDYSKREQMSANGRVALDGKAARRVADKILALIS